MEVQRIVGLLEAILIEKPPQISRELPAVLQVLMPLLHSPLAAPHIRQVFLDIGVCLMPRHLHHLGTCTLYFEGKVTVVHDSDCKCLGLFVFLFSSCARWARDVAVTETCLRSRGGLGAGGPGHSCAPHNTPPAQPHCPSERGQNQRWAHSTTLLAFFQEIRDVNSLHVGLRLK